MVLRSVGWGSLADIHSLGDIPPLNKISRLCLKLALKQLSIFHNEQT